MAASGCYFDLQAETWAHKANIVTQHGPFSLFAQVSMHWRGGAEINDGTEGHDVDCVMVKKDGCVAEYRGKEQHRRDSSKKALKLD